MDNYKAVITSLAISLGSMLQAQTNLITFDDGTRGQAIADFYAAQGVTVSNAIWAANTDARGLPFNGASGENVIWAQVGGTSPSIQSPIVFTFAKPQVYVAVSATDIGQAGARIEAYDAVAGGSVVGMAQAFGTGVGFDVYRELEVRGGPIRRVHLYQPSPNGSDGLVWDNLRFAQAVPGTTVIRKYAGITVEGSLGCRYRIEYATQLPATNWTTLTNVTVSASPYVYIDMRSADEPQRFYRAVLE